MTQHNTEQQDTAHQATARHRRRYSRPHTAWARNVSMYQVPSGWTPLHGDGFAETNLPAYAGV